MAEARLAVAFQFAVTDEGVVVNLDKEILKLMATSAYKSVKRRCNDAKNTFLKGKYCLLFSAANSQLYRLLYLSKDVRQCIMKSKIIKKYLKILIDTLLPHSLIGPWPYLDIKATAFYPNGSFGENFGKICLIQVMLNLKIKKQKACIASNCHPMDKGCLKVFCSK